MINYTQQEEIDHLRKCIRKYTEKENRIKQISILPTVYAMLSDRGMDKEGKEIFESLDDSTKNTYITMAKKACDHFMAIYMNDAIYKTNGTENFKGSVKMMEETKDDV